MQPSKIQLEEEYPEHLRHLYLAERERLDEEEQEKKKKRCKGRAVDEETETDDDLKTELDSPFTEKPISNTMIDQTTVPDSANEPAESDRYSNSLCVCICIYMYIYIHISDLCRQLPKDSIHPTEAEAKNVIISEDKARYERIKDERARKREVRK